MPNFNFSRAALVPAFALAAVVASSVWAEPTPISVGATVPITGPLSLTGKQYLNSLKLAEEDINNKGGINGTPISLAIEDAQSSNGTALNALIKVVQDKKPRFLFLTSYSTQTTALSNEVLKAEIPAMYAGGADSIAKLNNPWLFRIRPQDSTTAEAMGAVAKDTLKSKSPGIIYIQGDFGQGGAKAVEKYFLDNGISPVGMESYGQTDKDMSAQILNLKNKGADSILAIVYAQDGAMLVRQIKMLGMKIPVITSSAFLTPAALDLVSADDLVNVWGITDAYLPSTEAGREFLARYKQKFGFEADVYAAAYYDGALLMAKAMNSVGTEPDALKAYLSKVHDYQGVAHTYNFDASNNGVHDVAAVKFKEGTKEMELVKAVSK